MVSGQRVDLPVESFVRICILDVQTLAGQRNIARNSLPERESEANERNLLRSMLQVLEIAKDKFKKASKAKP